MAEYIDRQVLLDEIKKLHDKHGVEDGEEMLFSEGDIRGLLLCAPAADVATVRHGHWISADEASEKVEMMKFVCEKCGCIFVANPADECYEYPEHVKCPQDGCDWYVLEHTGEPYEEPAPTQTGMNRLELVRLIKNFRACGLETADCEADFLIAYGVTFKEK